MRIISQMNSMKYHTLFLENWEILLQNLSSAAVGISFGDYLNTDCEIYKDKLFSTSMNENTFTMCSYNFVRSRLIRINTVFTSACNNMLIIRILKELGRSIVHDYGL